ncbi:hypothetical protein [Streptomyces rubradiris]|uniref:Uncharacterized protein n=1 Tax=Streptomyces rubradiris TaxID=285531 RepID=A0ABQ3RA73_STRRR|nr:hypothetical protein [Streptomyces rubradiris]GHH25869.1 hypothetical protein GCM10018792_65560 [Streptomyces rubradiris]GHI52761.1 hypothetical protein Srubr_26070 [Streptomyces rubradiris]
MTAQPDHQADRPVPPMRTLAELRAALSVWAFPGDRQEFEEELDGLALDDLTGVRNLIQAYRHRVMLRCDPQGMAALMRGTEDVAFELSQKMAERNGTAQ